MEGVACVEAECERRQTGIQEEAEEAYCERRVAGILEETEEANRHT